MPQPTEDQMEEFLLQHYPDLFEADEQTQAAMMQEKSEANPQSQTDRMTIASELLELFIRAIPLVPRKHVRAAELLILTQKLASDRKFSFDPIRLAQFILLQLFAPELYRFGKRHTTFMTTGDKKSDKYFLQRTTAVGLYPPGMAHGEATKLYDQSGNIWEWCLNDYDKLEIKEEGGNAVLRVLRGGSWGVGAGFASSRGRGHAGGRDVRVGFRVCCVPAINGTLNSG
ncbi:MAG: SUMF1/EgtB/PvdO family nonheme iron enzyme [Proteobacteria bacterium]|nr:SUMF1/EgtB/PvdO family nonheme iron enzyme [Pseudomonadota bacterium]